jgi:hypothetical protein
MSFSFIALAFALGILAGCCLGFALCGLLASGRCASADLSAAVWRDRYFKLAWRRKRECERTSRARWN